MFIFLVMSIIFMHENNSSSFHSPPYKKKEFMIFIVIWWQKSISFSRHIIYRLIWLLAVLFTINNTNRLHFVAPTMNGTHFSRAISIRKGDERMKESCDFIGLNWNCMSNNKADQTMYRNTRIKHDICWDEYTQLRYKRKRIRKKELNCLLKKLIITLFNHFNFILCKLKQY